MKIFWIALTLSCEKHQGRVLIIIMPLKNNSIQNKLCQPPLWVAECDIKGVFDCVHHDEARIALERAVQRIESNGD
jgi:hypothetical protein